MFERLLKYSLILLIIAHVLGLGYGAHILREEINKPRAISEKYQDFSIPEGTSFNDVLVRLRELNLAPEPVFVRLFINFRGERIVVKKGDYRLPEQASTLELLNMFHEGKVALYKLTVPEGLNKWETAELLASHEWGNLEEFTSLVNDPSLIRSLDPDASDLEGYLFPETYFFPKETTPREIVQAMINHFTEHIEPSRDNLVSRRLTVREWVALASLIEEETSRPEERAVIAGVFENRLNKGMLLQCDPTIVYSLLLENRYRGKIYRSDIKFNHPYNTYVSKGIPPGPISNPGAAALEAALTPADTPFYYFVAQADGSHYFSKTLREHNRAVRRYRQGK